MLCRSLAAGAAVILLAGASQSEAQDYRLKLAGTVQSIYFDDGSGKIAAAPPGAYSAGDPYSIAINFGLDRNPILEGDFGAIYRMTNAVENLTVGTFSQTIDLTGGSNGLYLGVNDPIPGYDNFEAFTFVINQSVGVVPFDLGSGRYAEAFGLYLGDATGSTITALTIDQIPHDASGFSGSNIQLGLLNADSGQYVGTSLSLGSFSIIEAPEPATWAMTLLGFGMVGFGLRNRRRQYARITYA